MADQVKIRLFPMFFFIKWHGLIATIHLLTLIHIFEFLFQLMVDLIYLYFRLFQSASEPAELVVCKFIISNDLHSVLCTLFQKFMNFIDFSLGPNGANQREMQPNQRVCSTHGEAHYLQWSSGQQIRHHWDLCRRINRLPSLYRSLCKS